MFNRHGHAIEPSPGLTDTAYVRRFMEASEQLLRRALESGLLERDVHATYPRSFLLGISHNAKLGGMHLGGKPPPITPCVKTPIEL
jgi:hypothetical protein